MSNEAQLPQGIVRPRSFSESVLETPPLRRTRQLSLCSDSRSPNSNNSSNLAQKYRNYTFDFKLKIVSECSEPDASNRSVAKKYKLNESTIRGWLKNKDLMKAGAVYKFGKLKKRLTGGGRKPLAADMEERLVTWIEGMREKNLRVTVKAVCNQASIFYEEMHPDGPLAQELWQLKSEEIDFKNLCKKGDGEDNIVDDDIEEEEEVDETDEYDEASIMMEEEIELAPNPSSTSIGEFSLPLITLNEESQEETEESQEETEESEEEAEESEEEAGDSKEVDDEPNLVPVPTRNNNKRKRSLGLTGPSNLSKRICF